MSFTNIIAVFMVLPLHGSSKNADYRFNTLEELWKLANVSYRIFSCRYLYDTKEDPFFKFICDIWYSENDGPNSTDGMNLTNLIASNDARLINHICVTYQQLTHECSCFLGCNFSLSVNKSIGVWEGNRSCNVSTKFCNKDRILREKLYC